MKTQLRDEIHSELEELKKIELGTEQYKVTVDGITKLMDRAIEIDKLNSEVQEKVDSREIETQLKIEQMKDDKKDRRTKNWLTAIGIGVPSAITVWGTIKSLNFEKDGIVTTIMGKGFINKLLPKK